MLCPGHLAVKLPCESGDDVWVLRNGNPLKNMAMDVGSRKTSKIHRHICFIASGTWEEEAFRSGAFWASIIPLKGLDNSLYKGVLSP